MDEEKDVEVDIGMYVIMDGMDDVEGDVDMAQLAMDEEDDVEVDVGMEVAMVEVVDMDMEVTMDEVDVEVDTTKDAEVSENVELDDEIGIKDDVVTVDVEDTDMGSPNEKQTCYSNTAQTYINFLGTNLTQNISYKFFKRVHKEVNSNMSKKSQNIMTKMQFSKHPARI